MNIDDHGNYKNVGEKHNPKTSLKDIVTHIKKDLKAEFPKMKFSIKTKKFIGGQSIYVDIDDADETDLKSREETDSLINKIGEILAKYNSSSGNIHQDYSYTFFYPHVDISSIAYSSYALKNNMIHKPIKSTMSLAEFKRTVKAGDKFTPLHDGSLSERTVESVRSKDIIFKGPIYLDLNSSKNFSCDGEYIQIYLGSYYDPARTLLYKWNRT